MHKRETLLETALAGAGEALRTCFAEPRARRPLPAAEAGDAHGAELDAAAQRCSIRLMRVNHAGEVAAQALYNGQALFARAPETLEHLIAAAEEENDHLAWCAQRLAELGGSPSRLTPLWFAGSFCIGALAGMAGDRRSLGFISETETQVEAHLEDHLRRLPDADIRSRRILERMAAEESQHGAAATARGADAVPALGTRLMHLGGSILRQVAQVV
ncbi:MAG TPA: 2-polyprenyl-3-methyl-6-methoxy-1,4-benzoquinone monooxygenase [Gammaproteobacteria bacterium]|nr:2-polyprenyl-3-methyl-6-methoxy-1,4-benzoquinone monooxygenase [Gammaproteobacteria bacterium]